MTAEPTSEPGAALSDRANPNPILRGGALEVGPSIPPATGPLAAGPLAADPLAAAGRSNRVVGWVGCCFGAASGLLMGLWAFDGPVATPAWIGDYGGTSRRLLRLGHIAFFGIGILNLLLARELPALHLGRRANAVAAHCMNFANIVLPLTLFAAALSPPFKYLLPVPALGAFAALCLVAWGVWRDAFSHATPAFQRPTSRPRDPPTRHHQPIARSDQSPSSTRDRRTEK